MGVFEEDAGIKLPDLSPGDEFKKIYKNLLTFAI